MTNLEFIQQLWIRYAKVNDIFTNRKMRYYLEGKIIKRLFLGSINELSMGSYFFRVFHNLIIQTNNIFIPLFWEFLRKKGIHNNFSISFNRNGQDYWRSETFVNYSDVATYLKNTNPSYFIQHAFAWISDRSVDWCTIHLEWQEEIAKILTQEHVQKI